MGFKPLPAAVAVAIALIIWFVIPVPAGVTANAWHLLALFVATIAAIIGKAMPIGALSIVAIALVAVTGVTNATPGGAIADALSSFANPLIWLIGVSIMISRGIIKTGLGARIGYLFIAVWGKKTIGIAYSLALMPLVIYWLNPPEIKSTPNAAQFARERLREMGPITRGELIMLGVFGVLLVLWAGIPAWIFGPAAAVDPTTTAFIGLSLCLVTGVLTWDDVINEKSAWDTIVWFGALVMMATFLNKLGLIAWFAKSMQTGIGHLGLGWMGASALLMLTYLYAHYAFASTTAHITAMFAAFYGAGLALGAPALPFGLMMAAASNIMMTLTHYATGTSPVVFGSGYVTLGQWWKTGFIMSVVLILIWLVVGGAWWKALGYW